MNLCRKLHFILRVEVTLNRRRRSPSQSRFIRIEDFGATRSERQHSALTTKICLLRHWSQTALTLRPLRFNKTAWQPSRSLSPPVHRNVQNSVLGLYRRDTNVIKDVCVHGPQNATLTCRPSTSRHLNQCYTRNRMCSLS